MDDDAKLYGSLAAVGALIVILSVVLCKVCTCCPLYKRCFSDKSDPKKKHQKQQIINYPTYYRPMAGPGSSTTGNSTAGTRHIDRVNDELTDLDSRRSDEDSLPDLGRSRVARLRLLRGVPGDSGYGSLQPYDSLSSLTSIGTAGTDYDRSSLISGVSSTLPEEFSTDLQLQGSDGEEGPLPSHSRRSIALGRRSMGDMLASSQPTIANLRLAYDSSSSCLLVWVISVTNVPRRHFTGTADPYCRLQICKDDSKFLSRLMGASKEPPLIEMQTRVLHRTLSPNFNTKFQMNLAQKDLKDHVLRCLLCDFDKYSRSHVVGQVTIDLVNNVFPNSANVEPIQISRPLSPPQPEKFGELLLSLTYLPTAERINATLMKLKNIRPPPVTARSNGGGGGNSQNRAVEKCSLYFRLCALRPGRKPIKKKTRLWELPVTSASTQSSSTSGAQSTGVPSSAGPVTVSSLPLQETVMLEVPHEDMRRLVLLLLAIRAYQCADGSAFEDVIGRTYIGERVSSPLLHSDTHSGSDKSTTNGTEQAQTSTGQQHWSAIISSPRRPIAYWHNLT